LRAFGPPTNQKISSSVLLVELLLSEVQPLFDEALCGECTTGDGVREFF